MKLKKSDGKVVPMFSEKDIANMAKEYSEISAQIKELDSRKKELSEKLKQGAEDFGVKNDKGSFYLESDYFIVGKEAKKSISLDQEKAIKTLEKMGLGDVIDVVTTKVVNEDKLSTAVQDKRIDFKEVEKFTNTKVSYSVSVKAKEVMEEVEQTTLSVAKKKSRKG